MNTPLLQVILSDLEPLTLHDSATLRALAREARLVLTARNASSSNGAPSRPDATLDPKAEALETYQKALKLLQDPLLPVRAHGLVLLRHLIVPPKPSERQVELDPALVPGILSVFLQSVQEDDSYIFLNAVQGLVAMVDVLGQEILKGLVDVYAGGLLDGSEVGTMSKADLDRRLRVGEALNQSIRKCGDALGIYGEPLTHSPVSVLMISLSQHPSSAFLPNHTIEASPNNAQNISAIIASTLRRNIADGAPSLDCGPLRRLGRVAPTRSFDYQATSTSCQAGARSQARRRGCRGGESDFEIQTNGRDGRKSTLTRFQTSAIPPIGSSLPRHVTAGDGREDARYPNRADHVSGLQDAFTHLIHACCHTARRLDSKAAARVGLHSCNGHGPSSESHGGRSARSLGCGGTRNLT